MSEQAYYLNTFLLEVASINAFATGTLMLVKQVRINA